MFCFEVLNFYHELGGTTSIKVSSGLNNQHLLLERTDVIEKEYEVWLYEFYKLSMRTIDFHLFELFDFKRETSIYLISVDFTGYFVT